MSSKVIMRLICPFHDDTYPSLIVYADESVHCFGCGYHGSLLVLMVDLFGFTEGYKMYREKAYFTFRRKRLFSGEWNLEEFPGKEVEWDRRHISLSGVHLPDEWLRKVVGAKLYARALEIPFSYIKLNGDSGVALSKQYRLRPGKYIHSPGYQVYSSLAFVDVMAKDKSSLVLVEGLLDAWQLSLLGCRYPIYVLQGSFLSGPRINFLKDKDVLCMLDNDDAGRRIASEVMKNCQRAVVIEYSTGDPQELDYLPKELR